MNNRVSPFGAEPPVDGKSMVEYPLWWIMMVIKIALLSVSVKVTINLGALKYHLNGFPLFWRVFLMFLAFGVHHGNYCYEHGPRNEAHLSFRTFLFLAASLLKIVVELCGFGYFYLYEEHSLYEFTIATSAHIMLDFCALYVINSFYKKKLRERDGKKKNRIEMETIP